MKKRNISPVFLFLLLTIGTLLLSLILSLLNVQAEYTTVNSYTSTLQNNVIAVENMLSPAGIKYIVTNTVNNFMNFEPLGAMIIILIGIGVLEKSGFLRTFFTLIAQNVHKNTITWIVILFSILSSLFGNVAFVTLLPISALLFKYGRRNPLGGIIASFAGLTFGYGINIFLTTTDTSLLQITTNAAHILDKSYSIGLFFELFIMILATLVASYLMTRVTEKVVMPRLGKYEFEENALLEETKITNKELRGLVLALAAAVIYILIQIYLIVPGLPLSGAFLDNNATFYIDKLLGANSLFAKGFIFIVMFFFLLVGLVYGLVARTIKDTKDINDCLRYSLDTIGNILVLMLLASLFISIYNKSNIGLVIVASLTNVVGSINFNGIVLIVVVLVLSIICGLFHTGLASKWQIMSGTIVPKMMNLSISPELSQIVYTAGSTLSLGFTPIMVYYAVFASFLEKYDKSNTLGLTSLSKLMLSYAKVLLIMWFILIIGFYIVGLPLGIGSSSILKF